jgi:hypothetical protein
MRFDRRLISRAVVSALLAILLSFVVPVFVNRRDFTRAVSEYARNPTAENEAIMERERAENRRIALITHLEAAGVLFVLINLGWSAVVRLSRKKR